MCCDQLLMTIMMNWLLDQPLVAPVGPHIKQYKRTNKFLKVIFNLWKEHRFHQNHISEITDKGIAVRVYQSNTRISWLHSKPIMFIKPILKIKNKNFKSNVMNQSFFFFEDVCWLLKRGRARWFKKSWEERGVFWIYRR